MYRVAAQMRIVLLPLDAFRLQLLVFGREVTGRGLALRFGFGAL